MNVRGDAGAPAYLSLAAPADGFTHRRSLRARPPFTRPCRSFWSAYAELIRGQTPPNDFCNCFIDVRATKPGPSFPRRDDGLDHLPFRTHHAALSSSDARRAALRPLRRPRCWFCSLARGCPAAMPSRAPHHRGFTRRCIVRIDEHGSKDRAKDASRTRMRRCPVPASGAYALNCVSRRRSPPRRPSDIRCHRRVRLARRKPRQPKTSRPRPSFRQRPAKSAAFQKTGVPSSVTTREGTEGLLAPSFAPALSLTPPTLFPQAGESALFGPCKCHGAVTRDP